MRRAIAAPIKASGNPSIIAVPGSDTAVVESDASKLVPLLVECVELEIVTTSVMENGPWSS
ncbi:MAG: hypothetical protein ACREF3_21345, partial [Acetobacteraceae bacterium]